jgi:hypothetical protein
LPLKKKKKKKNQKPCGDFFEDSNGIIRRYMTKVHDRKAEAKRVGAADDAKEEMGKEWTIIDKAWMYHWLRFVWDKTGTAHAPGPVSNRELLKLEWDMDQSTFDAVGLDPGTAVRIIPRSGLEAKEDYRRISTGVWKAFMDLYGGGPPIVVNAAKGVSREEMLIGLEDTSKWSVVVHLFNGEVGDEETEWGQVQQDLEATAPCNYDVDEVLVVLMDKATRRYDNRPKPVEETTDMPVEQTSIVSRMSVFVGDSRPSGDSLGFAGENPMMTSQADDDEGAETDTSGRDWRAATRAGERAPVAVQTDSKPKGGAKEETKKKEQKRLPFLDTSLKQAKRLQDLRMRLMLGLEESFDVRDQMGQDRGRAWSIAQPPYNPDDDLSEEEAEAEEEAVVEEVVQKNKKKVFKAKVWDTGPKLADKGGERCREGETKGTKDATGESEEKGVLTAAVGNVVGGGAALVGGGAALVDGLTLGLAGAAATTTSSVARSSLAVVGLGSLVGGGKAGQPVQPSLKAGNEKVEEQAGPKVVEEKEAAQQNQETKEEAAASLEAFEKKAGAGTNDALDGIFAAANEEEAEGAAVVEEGMAAVAEESSGGAAADEDGGAKKEPAEKGVLTAAVGTAKGGSAALVGGGAALVDGLTFGLAGAAVSTTTSAVTGVGSAARSSLSGMTSGLRSSLGGKSKAHV